MMAHICPVLTNNNPLFIIQRSVITIFGKFTGIGIEIMKFCCAALCVLLGVELHVG